MPLEYGRRSEKIGESASRFRHSSPAYLEFKGQVACKPSSVPADAAAGGDHLSGGGGYPPSLATYPRAGPKLPLPSYAVLLRAGLAQPAGHPTAGALLPHHFTLTSRRQAGGGLFLWRFPEGRPYWELPSALSRWSSDFPRPPAFKRPRPPGHLAQGDRTPPPCAWGPKRPCSVWLFTVEGGVRQRIRTTVLFARNVVDAELG